jgi:hypothetical protein
MPRFQRRFATRSSKKSADRSTGSDFQTSLRIAFRLPTGDVIIQRCRWEALFSGARTIPTRGKGLIVPQLLAIGVMLVAVGYVFYGLVSGTSADFIVRFDGSSIRTKGKFPEWLADDLTRLLKDEMKLAPTRIRGSWQRNRFLKVDVDLATPPGDAQRIRNFLKAQLRG